MNKSIRYALLVVVFAAERPNLAAKDVPLAAGNLLQCTLDEPNLSSRTVKVGDPIVCYARPLQEFGCSVFPRGTQQRHEQKPPSARFKFYGSVLKLT